MEGISLKRQKAADGMKNNEEKIGEVLKKHGLKPIRLLCRTGFKLFQKVKILHRPRSKPPLNFIGQINKLFSSHVRWALHTDNGGSPNL